MIARRAAAVVIAGKALDVVNAHLISVAGRALPAAELVKLQRHLERRRAETLAEIWLRYTDASGHA